MEQGAVPTQRAKSSVLKFLQHRIVPSGCLAKRSTIGQDMHSPTASAIEQSAADSGPSYGRRTESEEERYTASPRAL
jgi:hypothetical protein